MYLSSYTTHCGTTELQIVPYYFNLCDMYCTGIEEATARSFVTAFYSSLSRGAEASHESLERK